MKLKKGNILTIYYNENNINNRVEEVRAIVDEKYVVTVNHQGRYALEDMNYYRFLLDQKALTIEEQL